MKLKVFVSQQFYGKTEDEIKLSNYNLLKILNGYFENERQNIEIIDTYFNDDDAPIIHLGKSIILLEEADLCVIYGDISKAKGCQVEELVCKLYGIPLMYIPK